MQRFIFIPLISLVILNLTPRFVGAKAIGSLVVENENFYGNMELFEYGDEKESHLRGAEANLREIMTDLSDIAVEQYHLNATQLIGLADSVAASRARVELRVFQRLKYDHPDLGEVGREEALMHIGVLPESDLKIGTLFYLEHTYPGDVSSLTGYPRQRCVPINYDVALRIADLLPYCEVLTSTIHGYKSAPFKELNVALSLYHAHQYNSSCNLVVDWSKGAKNDLLDVIYDRTAYRRQGISFISFKLQIHLNFC